MNHLKEFSNFGNISENLKYHLDTKTPITRNIFRPGSESFFNLLKESRELFDSEKIEFSDVDTELFRESDFGKFDTYNGIEVPLDLPMEDIDEIKEEIEYKGKKIKLNKPMRSSGPKKYKVYVKDPKTGNVKKVNFGDAKGGLTSKVNNPEARKSFVARHRCNRKWKPTRRTRSTR